MSKHTTLRIPDGVAAVVDGAVQASGETTDVPVLRQSEILNLMLRDAAERLVEGELQVDDDVADVLGVDAEALAELVPDHRRARYLRNEVKDKNWLADMRHGFEGRVRDALAERFRNGYDPEGVAEVAEGFVDEARIYWEVLDDDPETFAKKRQYVATCVNDYRRKHEVSDYDPSEGWLDGFAGVREGEAAADRETSEEQAERVARELLASRYTLTPNGTPDVRIGRFADEVFQKTDAEVDDDLAGKVARRVYSDVSESQTPAFSTSTDGGADVDRGDGPETDGGVDVVEQLDELDARLQVVEQTVAEQLGRVEHRCHEHDVPTFAVLDGRGRLRCSRCGRFVPSPFARRNDERLVTDGGRDLPTPGTEGYWEAMDGQRADGGETPPTDDMTTALDLIKAELNDTDDLHAVLPTERDGSDLYALTVRVQPAERGGFDRVCQVRSILVDTAAEVAEWQGNGLWFPVSSTLPLALGQALLATHNVAVSDGESRDEPLIKTGLDVGDDELAERILKEPIGADDGPLDDEAVEQVEDEVRHSALTCDDCGADLVRDEAVVVDMGGVEYVRCRGEHKNDEGAEE